MAALMAELAVAVLVCNVDGRILLYNAAARLVSARTPRSAWAGPVYGIVDRGLVTHALDRIRGGGDGRHSFGWPPRSGTGSCCRFGWRRSTGPDRTLVTGFVLVLEDETGRVANSARRDALLRELSEGTRWPRWAASGRPSRMFCDYPGDGTGGAPSASSGRA